MSIKTRSEMPRCARCEANQARYIDEIGFLVCGLCPITEGLDSIKIADVPQLLQWARDVLAGGFMDGYSFGKLREIIGSIPEGLQQHEADVGCSE